MKRKVLFVCLCCLFVVSQAQDNATSGKDFYITFTQNYDYSADNDFVKCQIRYIVPDTTFITTQYGDGTYLDNNVRYVPGVYTKEVDKTKCYIIPDSLRGSQSNKYLRVTSNKDVTVYAINLSENTTDATSVLPVSLLSNEYSIISQNIILGYSNISVVAAQQGTTISITDKNGNTILSNFTLTNKVFNYSFNKNITGYSVKSNLPIAVFSSVNCGAQASCGNCDHNYEQMWPFNTIGKNYFLWNLSYRCDDKIVVLATEDSTHITKKNGTAISTINLNKNETDSFFIENNPIKLESNKPIIVENIQGFSPSLKWILPVEQRVTNAMISPFIPVGSSVIERHLLYVMIVAGTENNTVVLETRNGITTTEILNFQTNLTDPNYKIATKEYDKYDDVLIQIINRSGIIAYMCGFGDRESYAVTAGAGKFNLQYFTIQTKTTPLVETYYTKTTLNNHTFRNEDSVIVTRYVEADFTSVKWAVNNVPFSVSENTNITNTIRIPASIMNPNENYISMIVRYKDATADSVYTGSVWKCAPISTNIMDTICQYQSYSRNNFEIEPYTNSGVYNHSITMLSYLGCDSVVNLKLTIVTALDIELGEIPDVCADDTNFFVDFRVTTGEIKNYWIEYDAEAQKNGFQNVPDIQPLSNTIELQLPQNVRANYYNATIHFMNKQCEEDFPITFSFHAKYASNIMEQKWNDVIAVLNERYNGNYIFSSYQWFKNGRELMNEKKSYIYVGPSVLDTTAVYHLKLTRADDGVVLETCGFTPTYRFEDISAYPLLVTRGEAVNITVQTKSSAALWTTSGIQIKKEMLESGANTFVVNEIAGTYILAVSGSDGNNKRFVMIVK